MPYLGEFPHLGGAALGGYLYIVLNIHASTDTVRIEVTRVTILGQSRKNQLS